MNPNASAPLPYITINGSRIGPGYPVYLIAELSANHGQSLEQAKRLVHAAKEAGADAVKLQTYTADTLTLACDKPDFQINGTLWQGRTLHDLYREAMTPWEWLPVLQNEAHALGLDLFSTPFDDTAVDFLEQHNVPAYKVASFEIVDLPLLARIARTGKPIILSTGMATCEEIAEALDTLHTAGCFDICLLKCTSAYPAPPASMHLRTLPDVAARFCLPVGLSDHTLAHEVPVAAVALGACCIEKHFTLSRTYGGPDSAFSLEPHEFAAMRRAVRTTEAALGCAHYGANPDEQSSRIFRRSLFVVADVRAGESFTPANVRSIRPGSGLHTRHLPDVFTRRAVVDIARGTPLTWQQMTGVCPADLA